jgi:sporulation protein YlmC with PRC-barrel domain
MASKSISGKRLDEAITSDDILGKDVFDTNGGIMGVAEKIFIDKETLNIIGIEVDKGILHKGLTIGKGYIKRITPHAIFLKTSIAFEMKGMTVFDVNGVKVGKVSDVTLQGSQNIIKSIEVRTGMLKRITINNSSIASVGDNVFLNLKKSEIKE